MTEKEMQQLEAKYIEACKRPNGRTNIPALQASVLFLQGEKLPKMNEADRKTFERDALPYCRALLQQHKERRANNGAR